MTPSHLVVSFLVSVGFSELLPYFYNETFYLSETFDILNQQRLYHISYWDNFMISDSDYQYPVIFALHGAGGNASTIVRMSRLHIDAAPQGYLTVYPEGFINPNKGPESRAWNAGLCCSPATDYNSNDAQYLLSILDDLEYIQNIPINRNKIFFTGHSNGGRMTYRMACEYPTLIAAIAPNDGTCLIIPMIFPK